MKFTVLGSGSSVPHPARSSSGYWVDAAGGSILLDCSASAIHRIAQEKFDWINLDAIWISHFHLDHIGGLAPLLFGMKHAPQTQERKKPLRLCGAAGLDNVLKKFDEAKEYGLFKLPFPLEIIEVEPLEGFEILPGVYGATLKTPHTDESQALFLRDQEDKTLVYTGDTGFTKELSALARGVDLFVMECSFVRNKPIEKHLELAEAMFLTGDARPVKAMLTHFYDEWDQVDFKKEVEKFQPPCEVIEAQDGLKLEF